MSDTRTVLWSGVLPWYPKDMFRLIRIVQPKVKDRGQYDVTFKTEIRRFDGLNEPCWHEYGSDNGVRDYVLELFAAELGK